MFSFLSGVGKLFVGIPIVIAVAVAFGFNTLTTVPVASHKGLATAQCSLSGSTVGGPLVLSGSGFTPGASYIADFFWPNGTSGGFPATADSSGNVRVSTYAWWAGTYKAEVMMAGSKSQMMASCSTTIR